MRAASHIRSEGQVSVKAGRGVMLRNEGGVALLLAIFGLLLLTAVAAAMLYSSDSETTIAVNYRDKEAATYSAQSALLEARDRIQPVFGDLAISGFVPTALPGPTNGQVLYIVNPRNSETALTVAPWRATVNGNPNPYFDKELCQENMTAIGLVAGNAGTPCAATTSTCTPVGTAPASWCSYYDESANATNWQLKDANGNRIPLDYKWVRVTLKADNSGLVYIKDSINPPNGTQVCWDGTGHQVQKPAAAGTDCMGATGGAAVASVTKTSGGAGYSSLTPPTVTLQGGGGSGASATATLTTTPGGINLASVGNGGSGYTSAPTVSLVSPDGTGAVLQVLIKGAPITALAVGTSNYCYPTGTTGETVNFTPSTPGTGSVATANVTMTSQACVSAAAATASCGKGKGNNTYTISSVPGGTGSGFSGTITLDNSGKYSGAVKITNVGSYSAVPASSQNVTISGCAITVSYAGGIKANVTLAGGGQYLTTPSATMSGPLPKAPSATQPTLNVTWSSSGVANFGTISAITVSKSGSGYSQPTYTLAFSGGGGSGAAGTAQSGAVTKIAGLTLVNGGSGYTAAPTVVITDSRCSLPGAIPGTTCGAGASGTAILAGGQPRDLGAVYMLTALAATQNGTGSQAMAQMEAGVRLPWRFKLGGALTLAGPSPTFSTPNSNNYVINGNDTDSCGEPKISRPAIGVWDDPNNPTTPTAVTDVISSLGKPQNYIGQNSSPDIENVFNSIDTTPSQLDSLVTDLSGQPGAVNLTGNVTSLPATTTSSITVVNGNLTLSGNPNGSGILVVTNTLTMQGDFTWNGLVLIIGQGQVVHNGGGNQVINGAMYVAQTRDASGNLMTSLGPPNWTWNGGGGNSLLYDHCLADNLLNRYPPAKNTSPLQVLSTRVLEF